MTLWLNVPYPERHRAQAAGARWDDRARRWYAHPRADLGQLREWLPKGLKRWFGSGHHARKKAASTGASAALRYPRPGQQRSTDLRVTGPARLPALTPEQAKVMPWDEQP